jgi:hypothetical protein
MAICPAADAAHLARPLCCQLLDARPIGADLAERTVEPV